MQILPAILSLELICKVVNESVIKILTAEVGVTSSRLHLKHTLLNCKKRDIEGASAKVKN